ncbi:MAG: hypothetical protein A3D10_08760 [Omnitrophica WOR_2 bacterium RIFCSPHIGHO2_02_FULL_48_11]|nr:MAG: hypothetical protein A3D10_08760 [Omnitrophica WOR_2 bacterium RIFCSPHIGHO2_02_FULL_48_11]
MQSLLDHSIPEASQEQPLCRVFGQCGGCRYQDIPYEKELRIKAEELKNIFRAKFTLPDEIFESICPSPNIYHYRHRLDLKLHRTQREGVLIGFSSEKFNRTIPIDTCPIAMPAISDFLPELKKQAIQRLTEKYHLANLVVRTGDDGRVLWGGMGRRSLRLKAEDYLWTEVAGRKIFYSLETFFQANLSILPAVIEKLKSLNIFNKQTTFFDLYGGVGLFGLCLAESVAKTVLVEEGKFSIELAKYNAQYHQLNNFQISEGRVEDVAAALLDEAGQTEKVVLVDPPRSGLRPAAGQMLSQRTDIRHLLYLSCHPESLVQDLASFVKNNWVIHKICPFDFFPRTKHIEALVILTKGIPS